MKKIMLILFLFLLVCLPSGLAFKADTHKYIAGEICKELDGCSPSCLSEIQRGSTYPDDTLHDMVNHHIYRECVDVDADWCDPDVSVCQDCSNGTSISDNVAYVKRDEWFQNARIHEDCEVFFDIGVASHYHADTFVIWHMRKGETDTCHSGFEQKIEDYIEDGKYSDWTIEKCGETFDAEQLDQIILEMVNMVEDKGIVKANPINTNATVSSNDESLTESEVWNTVVSVKDSIKDMIRPYLGDFKQYEDEISWGAFILLIWIGLRVVFGGGRPSGRRY